MPTSIILLSALLQFMDPDPRKTFVLLAALSAIIGGAWALEYGGHVDYDEDLEVEISLSARRRAAIKRHGGTQTENTERTTGWTN